MALELERYRAFLENSTEGIWRVEADVPVSVNLTPEEQIEAFYQFCYLAECNDAFARMYGFANGDELIGARLGDLLIRDDPANQDYLHAFIRANYHLSDAESVETDREGRIRHFSNSLTAVIENGFLVRAWGTQRDITAQHETALRLRESEARFRALADNMAQLAWMADASGSRFWYNQRWFDYTGTTMEEMRGWGWQKVHHPDYVGPVTEKFQQQVRAEQFWEDTFPLRGVDGEFRWFLSRAFPTRDESGKVTLWCGTNTDITEQREAEARQRRFLREMLLGFTEGRLRLCDTSADLPVPLPPLSDTVELSAPTLRVLRKQVEAVAEGLRLPKERMGDFETAVHEAAMNAVLHGGNSSTARIHGDRETGRIQVWVQDQGAGIAEDLIHRAIEQGWTTGGFGQGFFLMRSLADRLYLLTGAQGTRVVLEQEQIAPEPAWLSAR